MTDDKDDDKKIVIDSYTGDADGDDLKGCYFKYKKSNQTYTFHDKDDRAKCHDLTVGSGCSFSLDEYPDISWTITLVAPCTDTVVNGTWGNTDDPTAEEGTFQAQAGGTVDADASAASASGH